MKINIKFSLAKNKVINTECHKKKVTFPSSKQLLLLVLLFVVFVVFRRLFLLLPLSISVLCAIRHTLIYWKFNYLIAQHARNSHCQSRLSGTSKAGRRGVATSGDSRRRGILRDTQRENL
jgi:hypothetical protein